VKKPRFSVSIVAFNRLELTKVCIESVFAAGGDFELILTDNASSDGTWEYFSKLFDDNPDRVIQVFRNGENLGFIPPNRSALEKASGEFFVMLNNDATVPPGWLDMLVWAFDVNPKIGLTGPRGGCQTIDSQMRGLPHHQKLEYIEGACLMGRTAFLRRIGLFSPELEFAYWEDADLSLRVRQAGFQLHLADFEIKHLRSETSRTVPNILHYQRKNGAFMRERWKHYWKVRKFDHPIIIKRKDAMGDVLLTTPIIRAIKHLNPTASIWVESECVEPLYGNRHIERVINSKNRIAAPWDSLVIDLNMAYENRPGVHFIDAYAEAAGLKPGQYDRLTELHCDQWDMDWAENEVPGDGWIAVHAGPTTWHGKNWPVEKWAQLIPRLPGRVVLVGKPTDATIPYDADLRNRTNVRQLAAVLRRCKLVISVDSFPMHAAQAVGTPVVGLFGVTDPRFIMTDGSPSRAVCSDPANPSSGLRHKNSGVTMVGDPHNCMDTISVSQVLAAVKELLG
jgi:ADP-heptose:LPS heptosyltransferase